MADESCAKIILTRNPVESYISWKIARETGQWKLTDMKARKGAQVKFDGPEFVRMVRSREGSETIPMIVLTALLDGGMAPGVTLSSDGKRRLLPPAWEPPTE